MKGSLVPLAPLPVGLRRWARSLLLAFLLWGQQVDMRTTLDGWE